MAYDIYGNNLSAGHCEVHPFVREPYPCYVCMAESRPDPREAEYARAMALEYDEYCRRGLADSIDYVSEQMC